MLREPNLRRSRKPLEMLLLLTVCVCSSQDYYDSPLPLKGMVGGRQKPKVGSDRLFAGIGSSRLIEKQIADHQPSTRRPAWKIGAAPGVCELSQRCCTRRRAHHSTRSLMFALRMNSTKVMQGTPKSLQTLGILIFLLPSSHCS